MSVNKTCTKIFRIVVVVLIFVFLGLHFINLDADPPAWGLGFYQPADEGPYAYMAINQRVYGTPNPSEELTGGLTTWISENFIMNPIGNMLNMLGFLIFGNNYYGLRLPYVVLFLLNFFLLFLLLNRLRKRYCKDENSGINIMLIVLLWMAIDFSLSLSSRYVEPSLVRMTFTLLAAVIYVYMPDSERIRYFLLGGIITFSVFLVYITNIFLYLAAGIVLLYLGFVKGWKKFLKYTAWFILGCAVIFIFAEVYYIGFWGTEAVKNAIEAVTSFSEDSMAGVYSASYSQGFITTVLLSVLRIFSPNSFVYNLPVLFAIFPAIPVVARTIKNNKDPELLFLAITVVSFFIQGLVSYDTFTRKFIVVFPILISVLYSVFISREDQVIFNKLQRIKEIKSRSMLIKKIREKSIVILLVIAAIFSVFVFIYRFFLFDQTYKDYDITIKSIFLLLELIPLIAFSILEIRFLNKNYKILKDDNLESEELIKSETKQHNKQRIISMITIIALMCICNLILNIRFLWANDDHSERDAMIAMADVVDDQYILGGGFQLGYTMYNNMKPVVTSPKETMKQLKKAPNTLVMEYDDEEDYFETAYYTNSEYRFVPFWIIDRSFQAFGYSHNMCLYRAVNYDEYYHYLRERAASHETDEYDYPLLESDIYASSLKSVIFADIDANVFGDVNESIYGNINGSVYGKIDGDIHGNIIGSVYGDINGTIYGDVKGVVYGSINGNVEGSIGGNVVNTTD